ncbi:TetR family transcriptional regulator, partial [bacterium]|nr:TetR family transcriptional regulator [bacterium]
MSAEQTRDKILDAALKLFSQKGYLGAITREIAKEA